jgi:hypothetical protein
MTITPTRLNAVSKAFSFIQRQISNLGKLLIYEKKGSIIALIHRPKRRSSLGTEMPSGWLSTAEEVIE